MDILLLPVKISVHTNRLSVCLRQQLLVRIRSQGLKPNKRHHTSVICDSEEVRRGGEAADRRLQIKS